MPTKKVTCPKSKPVLLTVYVERPKRRPSSSTHPHQHHPYIQHTIKREVIHYRHGAGGQGYISRRAELLQFSQRLRLSARSTAPASKPYYQNHTKSPAAKIVAVRRKPKNSDQAPSCFGNRIFPSIFGLCTNFQAKKERMTTKKRSGTTSNKIKSAINSLKGQKKQGFFSKLFSASSKRK
ncbi:uncharacterized protein LOC133742600 [Rosa rugosa]|uniref:uncharacterized protein LOC133742600 n=1 Tax=Rosa rugosa TaxID=74645 RepID=UPI002B417668|nr:uncharacterized protein LOC133742600 [Rosa rugosa]